MNTICSAKTFCPEYLVQILELNIPLFFVPSFKRIWIVRYPDTLLGQATVALANMFPQKLNFITETEAKLLDSEGYIYSGLPKIHATNQSLKYGWDKLKSGSCIYNAQTTNLSTKSPSNRVQIL